MALEKFGTAGHDVVVLDPSREGDGLSCLRQIRSRHATVPIIAVSGAASPTSAQLLRDGADDYISKDELRSEVLAGSLRVALASDARTQAADLAAPAWCTSRPC